MEKALWILVFALTLCIKPMLRQEHDVIIQPYEETEAETLEPATDETAELLAEIATWRPTETETTTADETSTDIADEPETSCIEATEPMITYSNDEILLIKIASCEAGNQGVVGMAYVMRVVLNRVPDPAFPDTIYDIITQPGQFAGYETHWWTDGYTAPGAEEAIQLIRSGWDETEGAIAFCTPGHNQWHSTHLTYIKQYGNHQFYKF